MSRQLYAAAAVAAHITLAVIGCSVAGGGERTRPTAINRTHSVIGAAEIREVRASTAYDVIARLRPLFLRSRGPLHAPRVFVDNMLCGGVDELRGIAVSEIAEIRYLDSRAATQAFGTGYTGGVIHIVTRAGP